MSAGSQPPAPLPAFPSLWDSHTQVGSTVLLHLVDSSAVVSEVALLMSGKELMMGGPGEMEMVRTRHETPFPLLGSRVSKS